MMKSNRYGILPYLEVCSRPRCPTFQRHLRPAWSEPSRMDPKHTSGYLYGPCVPVYPIRINTMHECFKVDRPFCDIHAS